MKEKIIDLLEGMADLEWELGRMTSSGRETHGKMRKTLLELCALYNDSLEKQKEKKNG